MPKTMKLFTELNAEDSPVKVSQFPYSDDLAVNYIDVMYRRYSTISVTTSSATTRR